LFKEFPMSRFNPLLRVWLVLGTVLVSSGVAPLAHAADPAPQRIAMACTHPDAAGCQNLAIPKAQRAVPQHTAHDTTEAKAQTRRAPDQRSNAVAVGDGSRFVYDSCGCSN